MLILLLQLAVPYVPAQPPPPPPADTPIAWHASAFVGIDRFSADRATWQDWQLWQAAIRRRWPVGSLQFEAQRTHRFGQWDQSYALDAYRTMSSRTYANVRVLATPSAKILPRSDVSATLYRAFDNGWEGSLGARRMEFTAGRNTIATAALARSFSVYYARVGASVLVGKGGASSFVAVLRRAPDPEHLVEVGAGAGREVVSINSAGSIDVRRSSSAYLRAERFMNASWGVTGSFAVNAAGAIPTRTGIQIGLLRRW